MLVRTLALLALLAPTVAHAASFAPPRGGGTFGLGLGGGLGVSGLSGKYWFSEDNALQAVVGTWGPGYYHPYGWGYGGFALDVDYLWEMPDITSSGPVTLGWNLGIGAAAGGYGGFYLGASGVAGFEVDIQPVPIDIVLEWRPGVLIVPAFGFGFGSFTGHIRFYFA